MADIRTRFAPSPTGEPHVGNIRTALFAWLFARHNGGAFVLRIEDTDKAREMVGADEKIFQGLRWLGLDWDEGPDVGGDYGPYRQSMRLELYHKAAKQLVDDGYAYPCYCSSQRLDEMRQEQKRLKLPPGYDRHCRDLTDEERVQKDAEGVTPVIRLKVPLEGETRFNDIIRGEVSFQNNNMNDLVLLKSDGYPTYHLASVVDDHLMKITHVLRADEWISSTPCHILLYQALGYKPPLFAHLPMILGSDHSKLGKRHGAVSILDYREQGYLPEAMFNFLALLGWSLDDKTEVMSVDDIVKSFSLEKVGKTAAIFSQEKLKWMNGVYIRNLATDDFVDRVLPLLGEELPSCVERPISREYVAQIVPLIRERVKVLSEVPEFVEFFFVDELTYDTKILLGKKMDWDMVDVALRTALQVIRGLEIFDEGSLEQVLRPLAQEISLKVGQFFGVLRVATT
ncbi:MAG: glutamate--tRNA ligase, partial [Dehalococcoidia bacterium]|nr:glutamate--tRNA ligase [Dehalococcoidia bacterium]